MSTDLHTLSGAYALHALSPEESAEFSKHLDDCPSCQQEVRELRGAAATMGASEAVAPPAHLKARVLSAVDKQPQLPPRVRDLTARTDRATHEATEGRTWLPRILAAAAAVVLIAIGGFGVSQLNQDPESNLAAGVTRVFEAEDASTETIPTSNGGTVSVATSPSLGKMAVDSDQLPELSDGQVYQLWAIAEGKFESAGLLADPQLGAAMDIPTPGVEVAITIEPEGGSEQPSNRPIMSVVPSEV